VIDLEHRLARGPLRVRNLWSGPTLEGVTRRIDRRRRVSLVLDLVAACVCVAVLVIVPWRMGAPEGTPVAAAMTVFADGSIAEPSTRDTELRIEQDRAGRAVAWLTGGARFQVVHNPLRTFEVRAGDVRVRVLGTTFSVQELPFGRTQVLVERGRVEVAWLGGATVLLDGQGGVFPPAEGADTESETVDAGLVASPAPALLAPAPSSAPLRSPPAGGAWREYARAGDYARAYEELHARGQDAVRDETTDLMLAADAARLSGHPADAVRPLRALCDRHSSDRLAPVAAFTLGRVLLDDLGQAAEAANAFRKAAALWPSGPLAEDAVAREGEAWSRAGRLDDARLAARRYLARYPSGRHAAEVRKILSE
jgi:transmembrane sensor